MFEGLLELFSRGRNLRRVERCRLSHELLLLYISEILGIHFCSRHSHGFLWLRQFDTLKRFFGANLRGAGKSIRRRHRSLRGFQVGGREWRSLQWQLRFIQRRVRRILFAGRRVRSLRSQKQIDNHRTRRTKTELIETSRYISAAKASHLLRRRFWWSYLSPLRL